MEGGARFRTFGPQIEIESVTGAFKLEKLLQCAEELSDRVNEPNDYLGAGLESGSGK